MPRLVLFNKPYGVLTQFTDQDNRATLADYIDIPNIYPAGRLDRDSEGLLLLTDDGALAHQLTHPKKKTWKRYLVQVEGDSSAAALQQLRAGLTLKDGPTLPAQARRITEPPLWPRQPPIRERKAIPTDWLEIKIREGRNRQVRRMTAAVGLPTLRLIRTQIGDWDIDALQPGEFRVIEQPPVAQTTRRKTPKHKHTRSRARR